MPDQAEPEVSGKHAEGQQMLQSPPSTAVWSGGGGGAAQRWCPGALSLAGKTSSWLTAWDPRGALQQSQRAQDGSE